MGEGIAPSEKVEVVAEGAGVEVAMEAVPALQKRGGRGGRRGRAGCTE